MSVSAPAREIENLVGGRSVAPVSGRFFEKFRPADGAAEARVARSDAGDVAAAVAALG